jgi:hypothetical protein
VAQFPVEIAVGLRSRGLDCRPAAAIEQAKLDSGGVDDLAHNPAQSVYFANKMAFGNPADGRVAAHHTYRVHIEGDECSSRADAGRDISGFASGVSCADDDYVKARLRRCHKFQASWHRQSPSLAPRFALPKAQLKPELYQMQ